jgi:hypothetical protein
LARLQRDPEAESASQGSEISGKAKLSEDAGGAFRATYAELYDRHLVPLLFAPNVLLIAPKRSSRAADSPPVALRWSMVMQRKSVLNSSRAFMTASGQVPMREFNPPPGMQSSGKPVPMS